MALYSLDGRHDARSRHRWLNRFQTVLLVLTLVGDRGCSWQSAVGRAWPLAGTGNMRIDPAGRRLRDDLAPVWRPSLAQQ